MNAFPDSEFLIMQRDYWVKHQVEMIQKVNSKLGFSHKVSLTWIKFKPRNNTVCKLGYL